MAGLVNGGLLWIANRLLDWGWPPFLTESFRDVLPFINASLATTIAVNIVWLWYDAYRFRQLGQFGLNILSLVVVVRTWQVFPFDFSGYWSGWEILARTALLVAFFGVIIDTTSRVVKLATPAHH